jgi:hypothetical protein
MDRRKLHRVINDLKDVLEELTEAAESARPKKKYVSASFIDITGIGSLTSRTYTYEDPWGDLKRGDVVARPSGIAVVVATNVLGDKENFPLIARYVRVDA